MSSNFTTSIQIDRSLQDVFAYVAEPSNFPTWNSAVQSVSPAAGNRYVMRRQLPGGPAENELEISAWDPPRRFAIRTTSGPTAFSYLYRFEPAGSGTLMTLEAEIELPALLARLVRRGVDANFATLRATLGPARG